MNTEWLWLEKEKKLTHNGEMLYYLPLNAMTISLRESSRAIKPCVFNGMIAGVINVCIPCVTNFLPLLTDS